jgi:hypothetical protein
MKTGCWREETVEVVVEKTGCLGGGMGPWLCCL